LEIVGLGLRAIAMDVINDDAKGGFRRVEVLTGPTRRRRWSDAEKGRIVAETLQAGATVTQVARRWQVCPQQVWGWRREARAGTLILPSDAPIVTEPNFVPIVAEAAAPMRSAKIEVAPQHDKAAPAPMVEVKLAGAVVRIAVGTDSTLVTEVLRAVRASSR
jgi:transposase